MSNTITRGVRVIVTPEYLPEQSLPDAGRWLFAYHVVLRNEGSETVQLLNRHWVITNGEGEVDERGGHRPADVVGAQVSTKPNIKNHTNEHKYVLIYYEQNNKGVIKIL